MVIKLICFWMAVGDNFCQSEVSLIISLRFSLVW